MILPDFKYALTVVGGGGTHIQDAYFITDNQIYYKKNFSYDEINNHLDTMEFSRVVDLDTTDMDFESHGNCVGFDAPNITMYKIENGVDREIWYAGDYDNSEAVSKVKHAVYSALQNSKSQTQDEHTR